MLHHQYGISAFIPQALLFHRETSGGTVKWCMCSPGNSKVTARITWEKLPVKNLVATNASGSMKNYVSK